MVIVLSIVGFLIIFLTLAAIGGVLTEIRDALKDIRDELKEFNRG